VQLLTGQLPQPVTTTEEAVSENLIDAFAPSELRNIAKRLIEIADAIEPVRPRMPQIHEAPTDMSQRELQAIARANGPVNRRDDELEGDDEWSREFTTIGEANKMRRMIATFEPELVPLSQEPLSIGERFRANVRRLLRDNNLSQQGLADRLTRLGKPATQKSINELLLSDCSPRSDWIELMARAFDVEEAEITAEAFEASID
jgi:hypothetical protein